MARPHAVDSSPPDRDQLLRNAEIIISNVLRGGVILSAAVILFGVAAFYVRNVAAGASAQHAGPFPYTLGAIAHGVASGDPQAIIVLGLLLLLATPVLRVAVSIIAFALERDWLYTVITVIVLAILIASFLLGRGGG